MRLGKFPNLDSFCMKVKTYLHFLSTSIENGTVCPFSYGCFNGNSKVVTFFTHVCELREMTQCTRNTLFPHQFLSD